MLMCVQKEIARDRHTPYLEQRSCCRPQVPECEGPNPKPQVQTWSGSHHTVNVLPRWPNVTGWPSVWGFTGSSVRHVLQYNISDGWSTNLVSDMGQAIGGNGTSAADFWFMGSRRVAYDAVTKGASSYVLASWPQTKNWTETYGADGAAASRNFYFSSRPFNATQVYNTTYQVWGNFTVFVTHLSNNDSTIACHSNYTSAFGEGAAGNCSVIARRHLQCPFTFRCFSSEMGGGAGPRCLDDFDNGYNDTDLLGTLTYNSSQALGPKDVYGELICRLTVTALCCCTWALCCQGHPTV